jgi:tripartite-type tricarboxylate transporter receptor subunit TctC
MQDLVAGHIDLMFDQTSTSLAQVRAGKIRAYAVTAKSGLASAPDIPTVDAAGLPGFHISNWTGMWVPNGTPKDVIMKLHAALADALAEPAVRNALAELGLETPPPDQQTPAALGALQRAEIEKWWPIVREANIKGE